MTDRTAQARAEAERRWPGKMALAPIMKARFMQGVEWADANHPAVEALARVRELHTPTSMYFDGSGAYCAHCDGNWPCETYTATEVDA